jgi:hypothetical protein
MVVKPKRFVAQACLVWGGSEMTIEETLSVFFKSDARSAGLRMLAQEKVFISSSSDLAVHAFVRSSPPAKVELSIEEIESSAISARCNCAQAKRGLLCKHIWATILLAETKAPDFIDGKTTVDLLAQESTPRDLAAKARELESKERAREYRKTQQSRQKQRKQEAKPKVSRESHSPEVEAALAYFAVNGFPMADGISEEVLGQGKRQLSRVFHTDRGGTHEEMVELNSHADTLYRHLRG